MQLCPHCHTGKIEWRKVVYVQWKGPRTVIVDRIPAKVCDNCGEKTYDLHALENLQKLLWAVTAPPARHAPTPPAGKG